MPLVVILIDAMRFDYVTSELMPFCHAMAKSGTYIQKVYPSWGFCERTEIIAGLTPAQSGFWSAIGFAPENSEYTWLWGLLRYVEDVLPVYFSARFRRIMSKAARAFGKRMGICNIPFDLLSSFALTEDSIAHDGVKAFGTSSLFDHLRNYNLRFGYENTFTALGMCNGNDADRLKNALNQTGLDAQFIYLSALDEVGHSDGPESRAMREKLKELDSDISRFVAAYLRKQAMARFVLLGDHGMLRVDRAIDAEAILLRHAKAAGLRRKKDFMYFLDSTFMRIWCLTPEAEKAIPFLAADKELSIDGKFLTEESLNSAQLPVAVKKYGDYVWAAAAGVVISPDFFHCREHEVRGMHGYSPDALGMQGTFIMFGDGVPASSSSALTLCDTYGVLVKEIRALYENKSRI